MLESEAHINFSGDFVPGTGEGKIFSPSPKKCSDYYPFGLTMPGRSSNTGNPNDNYKYTGHERDDEAGLTLDYMGARYYDPMLPRFTTIDPAHELYPGVSPYAYVMNNPVNATDPDGRTIYYVNGEQVYDDGEDNALVVHTSQDIIDSFTEDGETNWGGVRNADGTTTEITDQDTYWDWATGIQDDIMAAFDGGVKVSADNKGNITYQTSSEALLGMAGEAAIGMVGGYVLGKGLSMLVKTGGGGFKLMFGQNRNQAYHAFRHLHNAGMDGVKVTDAISKVVKKNYDNIPVGQTKYFTVKVNGVNVKFGAHKFSDGSVNVGSIRPPR
jgi:RHS repeat-associated protein